MKKFIAALAVVAVAIALGVGASSTRAVAAGRVTIWHTFTDEQQAALERFAARFNESQDEYEVVVQSQAYAGFLDSVYNAVSNGVGPNIIMGYASTAADYVKDGLVVDLSRYVFDPEIGMEEIYESLPEAIRAETVGFSDGGMYALPAVSTGPVLFLNKTIYDELGLKAPATWEELAENARIIYEKKGIPGFAVDSLTDMMQSLMMQSGAGYIDTVNRQVLFGGETGPRWLDWFGKNVRAGYFALNPTGDYWYSDFNAKSVASYIGSCASDKYILPDGFECAVAPMIASIEKAWYPSWNRGPIVFDRGEEANRGAYLFVKYFLSPQINAEWAMAMNALSPYGTTQETDEYKAFAARLPASLSAVQANLKHAGTLPSVAGASAVRTALSDAAIAVSGGTPVKEAMEACVAACNAALGE